ncbi:MAG: extracellular solute-binding protein [Acidimicrobiales bacterium]|nr:extracellular solute-binding protein [Acidimicrobiales bacterium]
MRRAGTVTRCLVVVAALVLAACGAPGPTSPPGGQSGAAGNFPSGNKGDGSAKPDVKLPNCPLDALDKAKGKVRVTFWYRETAEVETTLLDLVKRYNASQDKVEVVAQNQGDELYLKYQSAIRDNQLPDIAQIYDDEILSAVNTGTLLPAQACMAKAGFDLDTLEPAVRSFYTVNGVFWPGYVGLNQPILYINAADFRQAGLDPDKPPRTLDELYKTAKALKKAGASEKPLAVYDGGPIMEWLTAADKSIVNNNNGRTGAPTKSTFDNPTTHEIFDWLNKMDDEGLLLPATFIDSLLALQGKSSMAIHLSGAASSIEVFMSGGKGGSLEPAAAPFPTLDGNDNGGLHHGNGFMIVNRSAPEVQAAAWDFLSFLLEPEQGLLWLTGASYLPFQKNVADSPAVRRFLEGKTFPGRVMAIASKRIATANPDNPGPLLVPELQGQSNVIKKAAEGMLFGGSSPDQAIDQADDDITKIIGQYWGD